MHHKKILYIGNQLSKHGFNQTSIEILGVLLASEGFQLTFTSNKKNQLLRLLDMTWSTLNNAPKNDYILIDTYSTSSFWYAFFCSLIARLFKLKYIPILRGGDLPNRLKKNPRICQLIFKNAFTNVAPSNYLKHEFHIIGYENITYIPNSIEIKHYTFEPRIVDEPKLLWVRAFAQIYNPQMAVYVLQELQKKYPNATLTMVGPDKDGSMQETKQLAKQLNLEVHFTGRLTKPEWIALSKSHTIFINTTHFDNTPVSVMEAMALGLPVVSTNVGGIPFLLAHEENAILVSDTNVAQMTEAITKLVKNCELVEKITHNARKHIESMDWEVVKNDWIALLK